MQKLFVSLNLAVKATKEQMLASLTREVNLLTDILQLKLQKAEMATRRPQITAVDKTDSSQAEAAAKAKKLKHKSKKWLKSAKWCKDHWFYIIWIFPSLLVYFLFPYLTEGNNAHCLCMMQHGIITLWSNLTILPTLIIRIKCNFFVQCISSIYWSWMTDMKTRHLPRRVDGWASSINSWFTKTGPTVLWYIFMLNQCMTA